MNNNLKIYEQVRKVPNEAKRPIGAGRLKGFTDINPMWRIKVLTEQFGVCGLGWYTEIVDRWIEDGTAGTKTAHCHIRLYIKDGEQWSKPIEGIGGASYIAQEKSGLFVSDECYKMAYTDAISIACKALGIGADVYFEKDSTKYTNGNAEVTAKQTTTSKRTLTEAMLDRDPKFSDSICAWLYDLATAYGGKIDIIGTLRQHYEVDDATAQRVNAIFNNYRMERM